MDAATGPAPRRPPISLGPVHALTTRNEARQTAEATPGTIPATIMAAMLCSAMIA